MNKLEYYKKELLKYLDKNYSEEVEKSISIVDLLLKSIDRSKLVPKQVMVTNSKGKTFRKTVFVNPNKQYGLKKYKETDSKGSKIAIGKLKKQIENCTTEEELYKIVLRNKDRFTDKNGKPIDIVKQLREEIVNKKNSKTSKKEDTSEIDEILSFINEGDRKTVKQIFDTNKKEIDENKNDFYSKTISGLSKMTVKNIDNEIEHLTDHIQRMKEFLKDFFGRNISNKDYIESNVIRLLSEILGDTKSLNTFIAHRQQKELRKRDEHGNKEAMKGNQNAKKDFTEEDKKDVLNMLKNPTDEIMNVEYTRENYNKLFPEGKIKTPTGEVKLGEHQFERLEAKDRKELLGAMYQTLKNPTVIIDETDKENRNAKVYIKTLKNKDGKTGTIAIVVDKDGKDISVSFGKRKEKQIENKIKMASIFYYKAEGGSPTIGTAQSTLPNTNSIKDTTTKVNNSFANTPIEKAVEKYASDKQIKNIVEKTSVEDFASDDPYRAFMNGVYCDDGYKVATNGRYLCMLKEDYPKEDEGQIKASEKMLKELNKKLAEKEKTLRLNKGTENEKDGIVEYDGMAYFIKDFKKDIENLKKEIKAGNIDGAFPNYKGVIPSLNSAKTEKVIGFEDFDNILKVAKVAKDFSKKIKDTENSVLVKIGNNYFIPKLLLNTVAIAKKYGLNEIIRVSNKNDGAIEFKGKKGSVVIMPMSSGAVEETKIKRNFFNLDGSVDTSSYDKERFDDFISGKVIKKSIFDIFFEEDEKEYIDNDARNPETFNKPKEKVAIGVYDVMGC